MTRQTLSRRALQDGWGVPMGVGIGAAIGWTFGLLLGQTIMGMIIGAGIGLIVGATATVPAHEHRVVIASAIAIVAAGLGVILFILLT